MKCAVLPGEPGLYDFKLIFEGNVLKPAIAHKIKLNCQAKSGVSYLSL